MIFLFIILPLLVITCKIFYFHFPSYKGAGIAIFHKGNNGYEILLGKRKYNPGKDKWSIPGGGYEKYDNSLFDTAKRECKEELSLDINKLNAELVNVYSIWLPKFKWKTFLYDLREDIYFNNKIIHEFSELKFISINDIKNYKLNLFVKGEIKRFLRNKKKFF